MEHQNTEKGVGTPQGGNANIAPNLEKDLQDAGYNPEELDVPETDDSTTETDTTEKESSDSQDHTNQDSEDDASEIKRQRAEALKQAYIKNRQEKEARAEANFYKKVAEVARDPEQILAVHKEDADLADRIAREHWGMSYSQLLRTAQQSQEGEVQQPSFSDSDIEAIVEKKLQARAQKTTQQKIEETVEDFLIDHDVEPNTPLYNQIMDDYSVLKPKDEAQAKRFLAMIYRDVNAGDARTGDVNTVPGVPKALSRTPKKKSDFSEALKAARMMGMDLTEDDFRKYSK